MIMGNALQTTTLTQLPTLTRLPALELRPDRIICGSFLQYIDSRGGWIMHETKKPAPINHDYLCLGTRRARQRFTDGRPEVIAEMPDGPPLPSTAELNSQIPEQEWSVGLSGKPEAPWKAEHIVYALDLHDLVVVTYSNSTVGGLRAVEDLRTKSQWAAALYGDGVMPLIKLGEARFMTQFGERKRPAFEIAGWRRFIDGRLCVVDQSTLALDAPKPRPPGETLNDTIPY
jgi:hypothetical protein